MRKHLLSLMALALSLTSVPAAAQNPSQSGARAQATASARIINGEAVRFDDMLRPIILKQDSNEQNRHIFRLMRTRGEVARQGRPLVLVTEFH
ncbi:hypothetical protein [Parasphingorhabdus litoris]|uniref:hypothetical protein n=2 Tax=Parasphingorhabdus litoris TaxID=394733 RepID=UPI0031D1A8F2